jgi:hypothetical protein
MERGRIRSARGRLDCPFGGAASSENSFLVSSILKNVSKHSESMGARSVIKNVFPKSPQLAGSKNTQEFN